MNNIFDYLYWRGDLTFKEEPFNEVDNLIMSLLSYFPLKDVVTKNITIKDAYLKSIKLDIPDSDYLNIKEKSFFKLLADSKRYQNLILSNYVRDIDKVLEKQFVALSIIFGRTIYVSFGGTDMSIIGFKEDLNMSYLDNVPSQIDALEYLNKVKFGYKIMVGGHSKGGNLAIYASSLAKRSIQRRIVAIYNNDGPGFLNNIDLSKIKHKTHTYMPVTAIVGRLLNSDLDYKIVNSNSKSISQHSLYAWEVGPNSMIYSDSVDEESEKTYRIVNDWLDKLDIGDRKKFLDAIYNVMLSTNIYKISDLSDNTLTSLKNILLSYTKLTKEDRKLIESTFKSLYKSIKDNNKISKQ